MKPYVKKIVQKFFLIPQRYVFAIMGFLAVTIVSHVRVSLNLTITEMVVPIENGVNSTHYDPYACPDENDDLPGYDNNTSTPKPDESELFDWDEEIQGLILSAFNWGTVISHLPAGILSDKFGGKHILGIGVLLSSVFTLLLPEAAKAGYGWLIVVRVLAGLGDGLLYPSINNLLSRWIPLQEKGLLSCFVWSGFAIGTISGTMLSGYFLDTYKGNWPLVFYFTGIIGTLWFFLWLILAYSDPETHPFITDTEKRFIKETICVRRQDIPSAPPIRKILTSTPVWALIGAHACHSWEFSIMSTDIPKYMKDVLKYSIMDNGILSSVPYVVSWFSILASGWISDRIITRKWLSITVTRKLFNIIGHAGPAATLIAASYAGCDRTTVVVLFTLTMGLMVTMSAGLVINGLDLSPNYAGTLMAIARFGDKLLGILTPYLVGVLTPDHTLLQWRTVFWITLGVNLVAIIIFTWGGSGEVQSWNDIKTDDCKTEEIERKNKNSFTSNKSI